jgi:hypothetical protein
MAAASTAHRTAALAAAVFMAVAVGCMAAAVVAATDNRLSAPLDCYLVLTEKVTIFLGLRRGLM